MVLANLHGLSKTPYDSRMKKIDTGFFWRIAHVRQKTTSEGIPLTARLINLFCVGFSTKKDAGMALAFVLVRTQLEIFSRKENK